MDFIQTVFSFIVALGVLVTIHEYGHFWMARRCGVKVLRFSVGFGKPLFQWEDKQGTQFWISSIPLGGYVKMLDAREIDVPQELMDQEFSQKPVSQRIAVFAAGPLINLLFAVLVYWGLFAYGVTTIAPIVGKVEPGSPAYAGGLLGGDEIVAIDGESVRDWEGVTYALVERIGDTGVIEVQVKPKDSSLQRARSILVNQFMGGGGIDSPIAELGFEPYRPSVPAIISEVQPGKPAEQAGLLSGDHIKEANGEPIEEWSQWVGLIQASAGLPMDISVLRGAEMISLTITPAAIQNEQGQSVGQIGALVDFPTLPKEMYRDIQYSPIEAFWKGVQRTGQLVAITLKSIGKMVTGVVSLDNLSGPITIAKIAGDTANYGVDSFLNFLAYLSVSLGVLNLLPIPILDGGHILFACYEAVRGKPLSERLQQAGLGLGLALIAMFMVIAFYNDVVRLIS